MEKLPLSIIILYAVFAQFIYAQVEHLRNFRGTSKGYWPILGLSMSLATVTDFLFLIYYGWKVAWWTPFLLIVLNLVACPVVVFLTRRISIWKLGFIGIFAWPVLAYFLFKLTPG